MLIAQDVRVCYPIPPQRYDGFCYGARFCKRARCEFARITLFPMMMITLAAPSAQRDVDAGIISLHD